EYSASCHRSNHHRRSPHSKNCPRWRDCREVWVTSAAMRLVDDSQLSDLKLLEKQQLIGQEYSWEQDSAPNARGLAREKRFHGWLELKKLGPADEEQSSPENTVKRTTRHTSYTAPRSPQRR